jgi:predicted Fe-S protein YdhL (DUF1289 family)
MNKPQSPCINICSINKNGLCQGCFRTLEEIGEWASASDVRKNQILSMIEDRKNEI